MATDIPSAKKAWRQRLPFTDDPAAGGPLAACLRKHPAWRGCRTVFATPAHLLRQVRINALADGKHLVLPTPGLRRGFLLIAARTVPYRRIPFAATPAGAGRFGRPLDRLPGDVPPVDLAVAEAVAVDRAGNRIGTGDGFFDLGLALLAALGCLDPAVAVVACLADGAGLSTEPLPAAVHDIGVHLAVTSGGVVDLAAPPARPSVHWHLLDRKRVRRVDPLYHLWRDRGQPPLAG